MISSCCNLRNLSRRAIENIALYVFFVVGYSLWLNSVPDKLELFESWIDSYISLLERGWRLMQEELFSMKPNDSNQSVNAPFWYLSVKASFLVFGKTLFGYRIPGVLLTALAPVCMAEIVRRFFRPDLALWSGLLVGGHQHVIGFGRTGGYIGPTLTLELAIALFGFSVAFEGKKRSWWPLALCLALVPFFYSTVRYLCFIGLLPIFWKMVFSRDFRKANLLPLGATVAMALGVGLALTQGGKLEQALVFISARGEQFLITDKTVSEGFEAETINPQHRLSALLTTMIPERLEQLEVFYSGGRRFYLHRFFYERSFTDWGMLRPIFLVLLALGALRCCVYAVKQQRYLIFPFWSIFCWIPLLVTTGITPNRMLLGVPSDMFMILLGFCAPLDALSSVLPEKLRWTPRIIMWICVLVFTYYSLFTYYYDYVRFPNA
jgi:hypothetical protein